MPPAFCPLWRRSPALLHGTPPPRTPSCDARTELRAQLDAHVTKVNRRRLHDLRPLLPIEKLTLYTARHSSFTQEISRGTSFAEVCLNGRLTGPRVLLAFYVVQRIPNDKLGETAAQVLGNGDRVTSYAAVLGQLKAQGAEPASQVMVDEVIKLWAKDAAKSSTPMEAAASNTWHRGLLLRRTQKAVEELMAIVSRLPNRCEAVSVLINVVLAENIGAVDRVSADRSIAANRARQALNAPYLRRVLDSGLDNDAELLDALEDRRDEPTPRSPAEATGEVVLDASAPIEGLVAYGDGAQDFVPSLRAMIADTPTEVQDSNWAAVSAYVIDNHSDIPAQVWPLLVDRVVAYNASTQAVLVRFRERGECDDVWLPGCPADLRASLRDAEHSPCFQCRRSSCQDVLVVHGARETCGVCHQPPTASEHATWSARGAAAGPCAHASRFLTLLHMPVPPFHFSHTPDLEAEASLDELLSNAEAGLGLRYACLSPLGARQVRMAAAQCSAPRNLRSICIEPPRSPPVAFKNTKRALLFCAAGRHDDADANLGPPRLA